MWSDILSVYVRFELQHPKYPEVEPGGVHLIPQPRAAVALHNRAGTGQGTFQQLANQLGRAERRPHWTKPNQVRGHQTAIGLVIWSQLHIKSRYVCLLTAL